MQHKTGFDNPLFPYSFFSSDTFNALLANKFQQSSPFVHDLKNVNQFEGDYENLTQQQKALNVEKSICNLNFEHRKRVWGKAKMILQNEKKNKMQSLLFYKLLNLKMTQNRNSAKEKERERAKR